MTTLDYAFPIRRTEDFFRKAVLLSILFHCSLLISFTVKNVFFQSEPLIYENAVRVDLVALPDKLPPQAVPAAQVPPAPTPPKVEEKKPEPKASLPKQNESINLDKVKKKESKAFAKLKQMEAFDKLKKIEQAERRAEKSAKLFKGNQLSSGTELKGLALIQHDNYIANVKRHIYNNWALPEWLAHKELKVQVIARFDDKGNLIFKQVVKSSGNPSFDEAAINSLLKSTPVPIPPESLAKIIQNEGILIGFPE